MASLVPASNASAQQRATLVIVNRSRAAISELYVSSTRTTDWGDDRLGAATIPVGRTHRVTLAEGCLYDLQVVYADGRTEERMRANVCRSPNQVFTAALAHAAPQELQHSFALENRTSRTVTEVRVALGERTSPPGDQDWSDNAIPTPALPGDRRTATFRGDCHTSVRIVFDNGALEQRPDIDLCRAGAALVIAPGWTTSDPAMADGADAITIVNHSAARIVELYLVPTDGPASAATADDRLGASVIEPGSQAVINLDRVGACHFRLRAVFEGNLPDLLRDGIDFCPQRTITIDGAAPAQ